MYRFTKIWLLLISLTIFAFGIGWFKIASSFLIGLLLITTFAKGSLVIEYFMGLNQVQNRYRFIPTIWLGTVISLIALGYYL